MERAQKQAGLGTNNGQIHILRHTFGDRRPRPSTGIH